MGDAKKPVRVYVDGCFDLMHYGHANAMRQAKSCGDILVVGVHSDEEILQHKGPTLMNEKERYEAVRSCKWVDEVVEAAPYIVTLEILDKYNCDYCVHGEDITLTDDGKDVYERVKNAGRFKYIKRTGGVSTTDIVGRMLLMSTKHHQHPDNGESAIEKVDPNEISETTEKSPFTRVSHFVPTTRKIAEFSSNNKAPKPGDKIVYIDGAFDLFHVGHISALKQAKSLGDFLIVGIHDDKVVNLNKGENYPIMNTHERVLSVLSSRYVDEAVIGAPFCVTKDMIEALGIDLVVHGDDPVSMLGGSDPYKVPKEMGIYKEVKHTPGLAASNIVDRIIENKKKYEKRNRSKEKRENQFINENS